MSDAMPAKNTDRELYREPNGDLPSDHYANSVHVTDTGYIGMNVGGTVFTRSIAEWHRLATDELLRTESCTCVPGSPERCLHCALGGKEAEPEDDTRRLTERLATVVAERDKAREECGHAKHMQRFSANEASRFIRLKVDRDKTLQRVHDLLDAAPLISEHVGKGGLVDRKPMVPAADLRTALDGPREVSR